MNREQTMDELDTINAAYQTAETLEAYEAVDARFYAVDPDARTAWLAAQVRSL